ncbi:hypothetical protein [Sutcliffiella horikoshii]|uniref:hypothetical protein n=1 Tax=Sutcliffiella horikoshii TaxID=79883 RepID=UPI001F1DF46D|nr:hypothetical protein [Sutcliffiella horikoshii]MCG1023588.1 hypothetical protein [Sutcliffiella horikoshii]
MFWKSFFFLTIIVYLLLSLPSILGVGYVIDWVPEATAFQKAKGYIGQGLKVNFLLKLLIAVIVALIASLLRRKRTSI